MARLTLSEQVNALASEKAALTAQVHTLTTEVDQLRAATQLQQTAIGEIPALREQIAVLTKDRDHQKSMREMYERDFREAATEIEQSHAVLDGVEGAPTREYESKDGYGGSTSTKKRNIVTRLAGAFLSIAQRGTTK